ncbi:unnamed protein product, partial [Amoebophrya sp. A120]|eukprot:GSA120T00014221001.1
MASYNENESKSTPHGGKLYKKRAFGGAASSLAAGATVVHLLATTGTSVDAALVTTNKGQHTSTARVGTSAKTTSQRTNKKKTSKKIAAQGKTHRVLVEHEEKKNLRAGGKSKMHENVNLEEAGADPTSFSFMKAYCDNQTTEDTCQLDASKNTDNPVSCLWQWNGTANAGNGTHFCQWSGQLLFDEKIGNPLCAAGFALKGEKECTGNLFDDFRQWLRDPDGMMYAQFDCRAVESSAGEKACVSVHSESDDYQMFTAMGVGGGANNPQVPDLSAFDSLVSFPLEGGCKSAGTTKIECEETDVDNDGTVDCQLGETIEGAILLPLQENPQSLPENVILLELGSSSSSRRSTKTGAMPPPQCYSGQRLMAALLGCPAYGGGTGAAGKDMCETALASSCKATFDDAIPMVDGKWNLTAYPEQTIKCVSKLPNPKPMFGAKGEKNDTIITPSPPLTPCARWTTENECKTDSPLSCSWDNKNNVCKPKDEIKTPTECRDVNTADAIAAEKTCNGLTREHMGMTFQKCVWGDANTLEKGWMVNTAQFSGKCFEAEKVHDAHFGCPERSNMGATTAEKVKNCISGLVKGGGVCQANSNDIDAGTDMPTETADISCTSRLPEWQEAYGPGRLPSVVEGCSLLDVPAVPIEHLAKAVEMAGSDARALRAHLMTIFGIAEADVQVAVLRGTPRDPPAAGEQERPQGAAPGRGELPTGTGPRDPAKSPAPWTRPIGCSLLKGGVDMTAEAGDGEALLVESVIASFAALVADEELDEFNGLDALQQTVHALEQAGSTGTPITYTHDECFAVTLQYEQSPLDLEEFCPTSSNCKF